jgi:hypothetical protein
MHRSGAHERTRIREACNNIRVSTPLIAVATHNRRIAKTQSFHFFTKEALRGVIENNRLVLVTLCMTYANQCFLVTLQKHKHH